MLFAAWLLMPLAAALVLVIVIIAADLFGLLWELISGRPLPGHRRRRPLPRRGGAINVFSMNFSKHGATRLQPDGGTGVLAGGAIMARYQRRGLAVRLATLRRPALGRRFRPIAA